MGWYYNPSWSERSDRRYLIADLTKGRESDENKWTCLTKCAKGNVLWTVWEIVHKATEKAQRWIGCDLLAYGGKQFGWGHKPLEESMGPLHYTCPLKYFEMVPEPDSECAQRWRADVKQIHAGRKKRTDALRKNFHKAKREGKYCILDTKARFFKGLHVISLRPLMAIQKGHKWKIPRRMVGKSRVLSAHEMMNETEV